MLTDLPNLLTLSRIAAIPLLVALVTWRTPAADLAACALFSAAAITDYFDGKLARDMERGRLMRSHADRQGPQAAEQEPGVERGQLATEIGIDAGTDLANKPA